jgi:thiamine pyrophosphokinase
LNLYGALGGRYDHHHANIVLAYRYGEVTLHHDQSTVKSYGVGTHTIKKESHEKLSVFTLEKAVLSLSGVEYPLDQYEMSVLDILGLSNAFLSEEAILTVKSGRVLVYCERA